MATLVHICSPTIYSLSRTKSKTLRRPSSFTCSAVSKTTPTDDSHVVVHRRSANYQPSLWDHRHLLSIENKYAGDESVGKRDLLKENVRKMFTDEKKSFLDQLELIDDLEKLGISYHFGQEIETWLAVSYQKGILCLGDSTDLHSTALIFRIYRQHGFKVSEDVFDVFMENFEMIDDINGLISLYEASYLSTKLDTKLKKFIRPLAKRKLLEFVDSHDNKKNGPCDIMEMVVQALDMPYNWRMRRLATRWYIDVYGKKHKKNRELLEFARIDFNILQAVHLEELRYASRWWKETGLGNQLYFVRDRIVENYFWTVGTIQEPQFGYVRRKMTIINALVTIVDDIYDIYGTLEELQLFTAAIENWDVDRLNELPEYMRLCFLVVHNEVNSIGCDILREKNINVIPFLKKSWADICKAYLLEAEWHKRECKPNLEAYMQNAWITVSVPLLSLHFYCVFSDNICIQSLETLSERQQNVLRCSAAAFRLVNDLATSSDEMARGDVLKSIQCYMNETKASEEESRLHLLQIIDDMWDQMNYEKMTHSSSLLSLDFMEIVINLVRMSQCIYRPGPVHVLVEHLHRAQSKL